MPDSRSLNVTASTAPAAPHRPHAPAGPRRAERRGEPTGPAHPPRPMARPTRGASPETSATPPSRSDGTTSPERPREAHLATPGVGYLPRLPAACALPDLYLAEPYHPAPRRPAAPTTPASSPDTGPPDETPLVQALPLRDGGTPLTGYLLLVPPDTRPDDPTALAARAVAVRPQSIRPITPGAGATTTGTPAVPATTDEPDTPRPDAPSRPAQPAASPAPPGLTLDPDRRVATLDGRQLDLTYLEFELLQHLATHPYRVHTRSQLVTAVWGYGHVGDGRTVDVHIARLRRKLGAYHRRNIVTVRRVGYKYLPIRAY